VGLLLGIDVGGTFTDLVCLDSETMQLECLKVATSPDDPTDAVRETLEHLFRRRGTEKAVDHCAHGTTTGTNALIEGKVARTGLLTTAGFEDVPAIGRQQRPSLYDLLVRRPPPLVPRDLCLGVRERVAASGEVLAALDEAPAAELIRRLGAAGCRAIAVCLLHSYRHPAHERALGRLVSRLLPDAYVSLSVDVSPEFREYERLATTVINACLGPVVARYLRRLGEVLAAVGLTHPPLISRSSGGLMTLGAAQASPAHTALSGPAAGVSGAAHLCSALGVERAITLDIGGTSTDVGMVTGGAPAVLPHGRPVAGRPLRLPAVDIETIGAGGGSLITVDAAGAVLVGPESAGAHPGPACYGRGGTCPTLTDAILHLGWLGPRPEGEAGIELQPVLAARALETPARRREEDATALALRACRVALASMEAAVRLVTVERGLDPREFALLAYGGAGPTFASLLAPRLGIGRVIVPPAPATFSAWGLLTQDIRADFSRTLFCAPADRGTLRRAAGDLAREARSFLASERVPQPERCLALAADMRYRGQNYELTVPLGEECRAGEAADRAMDRALALDLEQSFVGAFGRAYGYELSGRPVEIVTLRLSARRRRPSLGLPRLRRRSRAQVAAEAAGLPGERSRCRMALPATGWLEARVHDRHALEPGREQVGPALLAEPFSVTLLPPGAVVTVDDHQNLIIDCREVKSA